MMLRKNRNTASGFAMLNILLGITLLTGIVYLIMHTMTKYRVEDNARAIGEQLAPLVSDLLTTESTWIVNVTTNQTYPFVTSSQNDCTNKSPLLTSIAPGYLEALKSSGFDLALSACVTVTE